MYVLTNIGRDKVSLGWNTTQWQKKEVKRTIQQ